MELWMHKKVAEDVVNNNIVCRTLEIGAGNLNHLSHEQPKGIYDIVEPFQDLYASSSSLRFVSNTYTDVCNIPQGNKYDRIISIAAFEHICNLPDVVARCGILLDNEGVVRIGIPSEGSVLWWLGWNLTTGLEFRIKHNLDYSVLMKYEHVNSASEVEEILKYFFKHVKRKVFGVSRSFSFYCFYECKNPKNSICEDFLEFSCSVNDSL